MNNHRGRPKKYNGETERINLNIPKEVREYLTVAAAKASIEKKATVSLTEYLCSLVYEDMKKEKK